MKIVGFRSVECRRARVRTSTVNEKASRSRVGGRVAGHWGQACQVYQESWSSNRGGRSTLLQPLPSAYRHLYDISSVSYITSLSSPHFLSPTHSLSLSLSLPYTHSFSFSLSLSLPYTHSLSFLYLFSPHVTNEGVVSQAKDIVIVLVGCSWDP